MKKIIALIVSIIISLIAVGFCVFHIAEQNKCYTVSYADFEKQFVHEVFSNTTEFCIYDTKDLTAETLENRTSDVVIVERFIGVVTNANCVGDGQVLNTDDSYYNYIDYGCVDGVEKGDIILTYLIYNPDSNYVNDVTERYDYILN